MNFKGIAVISVIVVLVASIAFLSSTQQFEDSMQPTIESDLNIKDSISLSLDYSDGPQISDSNKLTNSDVMFVIDENGKKQYTINVEDAPTIQE
jgi:hypothetical protein